MEKEKITVGTRIKMKELKNKELIEVSQDSKSGGYLGKLASAKGVRQ